MSTAATRRYLVAYDITDDRRRTRLAKLLERFGDRVQYSVFLIECSAARELRLHGAIEAVIEGREDSVLICDLGPVSSLPPWAAHYLGVSRPTTGTSSLII